MEQRQLTSDESLTAHNSTFAIGGVTCFYDTEEAQNSQVAFIAGVANYVKGILRQNRGRIFSMKDK